MTGDQSEGVRYRPRDLEWIDDNGGFHAGESEGMREMGRPQ